ncbi:putative RNA-binding protein Luc7-like 2 isoform X2 [Ambystoma mexicanum]|uniref:putative RNA-binding protein Luc7-like 2 isoform X2 n=1 Tax=Ambystoma mexicanum TaxID=8296 RepID=UPI0037E89C7B
MSAQAQMRAMLDQLMGTSRDGDSTRQRIKFSDDRVCKSHLLNCCPHDVLAGTRMDLGECLKVHDLALRADYEIASKKHDYFFELDAMDHLNSFIADCDRRTEVAKKRLAETQDEISAEVALKAEKVHEWNEEIGKLLAKAEQEGAEGNVEESQKVMDEVEQARANKREAEEVYRNSMPASSFQQQKLRVCEVCSAYLGLHDNDRRLADHFGGKLHLGFIEIREKLDELRKLVAEKQEKRNQDRLKRKEERAKEEMEKMRSRSRDRRRHRSRSSSRDHKRRTRSKSRDKRRSHRTRSRSRSHKRSRDRSRDRSLKSK